MFLLKGKPTVLHHLVNFIFVVFSALLEPNTCQFCLINNFSCLFLALIRQITQIHLESGCFCTLFDNIIANAHCLVIDGVHDVIFAESLQINILQCLLEVQVLNGDSLGHFLCKFHSCLFNSKLSGLNRFFGLIIRLLLRLNLKFKLFHHFLQINRNSL